MPTDRELPDAELRRLFHDASAPPSSIDAATVIRRSKRRRLPQQLGAGSVLTLAVAGIGVAGFTGLRGLTPMGASEMAADAPAGVSESAPFSGADSSGTPERAACESGVDIDADAGASASLEAASRFPTTASPGQLVAGSVTLTNTGTEAASGSLIDSMVSLSRDGAQLWHRNASAGDTRVELDPGESMNVAFSFTAIDCETPGTPLAPGRYELSVVLKLVSGDGSVRVVVGPASVIALR